jgi:hypothetical protein
MHDFLLAGCMYKLIYRLYYEAMQLVESKVINAKMLASYIRIYRERRNFNYVIKTGQ